MLDRGMPCLKSRANIGFANDENKNNPPPIFGEIPQLPPIFGENPQPDLSRIQHSPGK
jgi:hypothetical protein